MWLNIVFLLLKWLTVLTELLDQLRGGTHDRVMPPEVSKTTVNTNPPEDVTVQDNKKNESQQDQRRGSVVDPNCRADRPQAVTFADVTSAAFKMKNGVVNTPCLRSHMSDITGMEIFLKKDFMQTTGSFKERGACYALMMLSDAQKQKGVISASLGNHALALSYHGQRLGIPVTVVMPVVAPIMKETWADEDSEVILDTLLDCNLVYSCMHTDKGRRGTAFLVQACKKYGATVIVEGNDMKEAKHLAMLKGKELGLTYINGYDHPHIIAGQGTLGLEIVEQVPDIDAVVVPVGGGGLIAGVALAVKSLHPNVKIIGVESDRCPSFIKAMQSGQPTPVTIHSTLADGLAVPLVGYNAFHTARPLIDKMVVVKEDWIAIAILRLVEMEKCVVEGAGAVGLAAILAGHLADFQGKRVVLILCGGNIDTTILGRCLDRGLTADGRLLKFSVVASDRPGGIAELCRLLADTGVSIKDILHERAWITNDVFSVKVKIVCESRDIDHTRHLMKVLRERYKSVNFGDFLEKLDSPRNGSPELDGTQSLPLGIENEITNGI